MVLSPLAHWDAVWFLGIADTGYDSADSPRTAFFPLYPLLTRGVAELGGGSQRGAADRRLPGLARGPARGAGAAVPAHRARARPPRRGAGGAAAVRVPGVAVPGRALLREPVPALLGGRVLRRAHGQLGVGGGRGRRGLGHPQRRPAPAAAAGADLPLRPAGGPAGRAAGRCARAAGWSRCGRCTRSAATPRGSRSRRSAWWPTPPGWASRTATRWRSSARRTSGAGSSPGRWWASGTGRWRRSTGARQLLSGSTETVYFEQAGGDPMRVAAINLMLFGFLCFGAGGRGGGAAAAAVRLRRLRGRGADAAAELPGRARSR